MIACVRIPYIDTLLTVQERPDLHKQPFALMASSTTGQRVHAASPTAAAIGISPGLTEAEALTICPDIPLLPAHIDETQHKLDDVLAALAAFTDRVELERDVVLRADARRRRKTYFVPASQFDDGQAAVFFLDLGRLHTADAQSQATQIAVVVADLVGLSPTVTLASGRFIARTAAVSLKTGEQFIVGDGQEASFLADFPVTLLPLDAEFLRQLHLLGLTTLGQIVELPVGDLLLRFGQAGRTMHRLAQGKDSSPVARYAPRIVIEQDHSFDTAITDRQILDNVLAELMQHTVKDDAFQGQTAREVRLSLTMDNDTQWGQSLTLREAVGTAAGLLAAMQELMIAAVIDAGVVDLRCTIAGFEASAPRQLSLFERNPASQEDLQAVLEGFMARYGSDTVVNARMVNPDARLLERRVVLERAG